MTTPWQLVKAPPPANSYSSIGKELLFVYGNLMKHMSYHSAMAPCKFICDSETQAKYMMYVEGENVKVTTRGIESEIFGELYECPDSLFLKEFDKLLGHPKEATRMAVKVKRFQVLGDGTLTAGWTWVPASVYFYNNITDRYLLNETKIIKSGDYRAYYYSNIARNG